VHTSKNSLNLSFKGTIPHQGYSQKYVLLPFPTITILPFRYSCFTFSKSF
jgi:hypothetical protein